jgi:hypothetical protein
VTTGLLYLGLRVDLGMPASAAISAVAYNALIVLVKFVLGLAAVYESSRRGLEGAQDLRLALPCDEPDAEGIDFQESLLGGHRVEDRPQQPSLGITLAQRR